MITAKDLIVSAECVETGERLIGYVCCCKHCQTAWEYEKHDAARPLGLLTTADGINGNIRVYTDNMEFVEDRYLVTGVEDGWIKVDKETWEEYLQARERLK